MRNNSQNLWRLQKKCRIFALDLCGGVVIGGLSPLFTGDDMSIFNYLCIGFGSLATVLFAYFGNEILKVKLNK